MTGKARFAVALAVVAVLGGIVYLSIPRSAHSCEVCLEFDGNRVCRRGAGNTQEEARQAAHESSCGGNARGMSEVIACRNQEPVAVTCTGP